MARRKSNFGIFTRLNEPRIRARLEPAPVGLRMLGFVLLADQLAQPEVKFITSNLAVSRVEDLGQHPIIELAKGQVERAATPVKNRNQRRSRLASSCRKFETALARR